MEMLTWRGQAPAALVLRTWLGVTFTYAGVQKLSDPGFLTKGSTTYIGTQLGEFARASPIGPLLHLVAHAPVLAGAGVALTEIVIGLATLAGVAPVAAAGAGLLLSVSLWLSASWHVHPYFLGSDSIYAVAWLAYLLTLPNVLRRLQTSAAADPVATPRDERRPPAGRKRTPRPAPVAAATVDDRRRDVLRGGAVVVGGLALGGVAAVVGHGRRASGAAARGAQPTAPAGAASSSAAPSASGGPVITSLADLRSKGAVGFDDPTVGSSVVVSLGGDKVAAFSRSCTHAGCAVDYDPSSKLLFCPCHGSTFDPARGAAVDQGPASQPLPAVNVVVDRATGDVRQA